MRVYLDYLMILVASMVFLIGCKGKNVNIKSKKLNKENTVLKIDDSNAKIADGVNEKIIYKYFDGNGNGYIITSQNISYNPVPMIMTSTGYTDNGKALKKNISKKNYENVKKQFDNIFKNKKIHLKNRPIGSGTLRIENDSEYDRIVIQNGDEKFKLESFLKSLFK